MVLVKSSADCLCRGGDTGSAVVSMSIGHCTLDSEAINYNWIKALIYKTRVLQLLFMQQL